MQVRLDYNYSVICRYRMKYNYSAICRYRLEYSYSAICRYRLEYSYSAICRYRLENSYSAIYRYFLKIKIINRKIPKLKQIMKMKIIYFIDIQDFVRFRFFIILHHRELPPPLGTFYQLASDCIALPIQLYSFNLEQVFSSVLARVNQIGTRSEVARVCLRARCCAKLCPC